MADELRLIDVVQRWSDITPEEFDEIHMAIFQGDTELLHKIDALLEDHNKTTIFLGGVIIGKTLATRPVPQDRRRPPRGYRGSVDGG